MHTYKVMITLATNPQNLLMTINPARNNSAFSGIRTTVHPRFLRLKRGWTLVRTPERQSSFLSVLIFIDRLWAYVVSSSTLKERIFLSLGFEPGSILAFQDLHTTNVSTSRLPKMLGHLVEVNERGYNSVS